MMRSPSFHPLLSPRQVELLQAPCSSIWTGCSSAQAVSEVVRLSGVRLSAEVPYLELFLPAFVAQTLLRYLGERPQLCLLCSSIFTFEAIQVKGRFVDSRPSTEEELAWQRAYLAGFARHVIEVGVKQGAGFNLYLRESAVTLRMVPEEVFDQTPKAGAGKKIS